MLNIINIMEVHKKHSTYQLLQWVYNKTEKTSVVEDVEKPKL